METKHLKVWERDHRVIKELAAKTGKTIQNFMRDLIAAYNKASARR